MDRSSPAGLAPSTGRPERSGRDRGIDAVRAIAILGVVGGHWLVTGLVVDSSGAWRQASPLTAMPFFAPISWVLQTLGLFFFAGGFAAARSRRRPRLRKLVLPIAALLTVWAVALTIGTLLGMPDGTRRTIIKLVVSPLWFLLPYLALAFATGPLSRAVDRVGVLPLAAPAVAVVALSDAGSAPAWTAVAAAWSVPWLLGIALARSRPAVASAGVPLLLGGAAALATLILALDYPASAVGVPGDGRSNLSPPSLLAVALASAQIGLYLLIREAARRRRSAPVDNARKLSYPAPTFEPTQCRGGGGGGPRVAFRIRAVATVRAAAAGSQTAAKSQTGSTSGVGVRSDGAPAGASAIAGHAGVAAQKRGSAPESSAGLGRGVAESSGAPASAAVPGFSESRGSSTIGALVASLNRAALPIYLLHQTALVIVVAGASAVWSGPVPGLLTRPQDPQWIFARLAWLPFLALTLAALLRVPWPTPRAAGRRR